MEADRVRDQALAQLGLTVLQFDNKKVLTQIDVVVEQIYCIFKQRLESPFRKGGTCREFDGGIRFIEYLLFKERLEKIYKR